MVSLKRIIMGSVLLWFPPLWGETSILMIHSYHAAYPWTKAQNSGFISVLDNTPNLYPFYSTEYLDTKRRGMDEPYEEELVRYLSSKYKGYRPDLIYVTDDNALHFILHHKRRLFPSVPVVFSGINDLSKREQLRDTPFQGVFEIKEILPNLKLIEQLFPNEKETLVIGDGTATSQAIYHTIERELAGYRGMNLRYVDTSDLESVLSGLRRYTGKTVVLTSIGAFRDRRGELVTLNETIDRIRESGNFFLISTEDTYVKNGVLGGYAVNGLSQGSAAGRIALGLLNRSGNIPLSATGDNANGWIFDARVLEEKGIKLPDAIASQARFVNLPRTFYQTHEALIIDAIYTLVGGLSLMGFMFTLFLYRSRKTVKERERSLRILTQRLNKAQTIAHIGNWEWELGSGALWWSDEIYRIFGLEPDRMIGVTYERFMDSVHPEDREKVRKAVDQALRVNGDYRIVHRIIRPGGEVRYVREEGYFEIDEAGAAVKMLGTVHDITEKKIKEEIMGQQAQILEASEKKYRALVENAMIGVYRSTLSGEVLYVNPALASMLGYESAAELIGQKSVLAYKNKEERDVFVHAIQEEHSVSNYEIDLIDRTGKTVPVMLSATLEGETFSGMIIDMREIKKSRQSIEKFSKIVEQIDDSVVITDVNGIITYVNPAFSLHTGFAPEEAVGRTSRILSSGQHESDFYQKMWKTILGGEVFRETFINRKKNGDIYYENKTITPIKDEANRVVGFVSSSMDVTEQVLENQETRRIATTDKLTGIYNRHKFEELFILESERARRFSLPLSLIMIDIDHFKSINDTYGHDVGDVVLIYLANIVRDNIRKIDVFARWGGEEFLVLCPGTDLERVRLLAEKIRIAVDQAVFLDVGHVTISLGISSCRGDDSFAALFKRADEGLYRAKAGGRNQTSSGG